MPATTSKELAAPEAYITWQAVDEAEPVITVEVVVPVATKVATLVVAETTFSVAVLVVVVPTARLLVKSPVPET
jgi:hypothetical protein